jgi:hypothetical protein
MQINRSRASMKSSVWKVHIRQHQDQHDEKQQAHQNRQTRPVYRPAFHGTEGNMKFSSVKPHERAMRLRASIVGYQQTQTARSTIMLASS